MKVLISGSRKWRDENSIKLVIDYLQPGDTVIHGAASSTYSSRNASRKLVMNDKRIWELPTFRRFPPECDGGIAWCVFRKYGIWHLRSWNREDASRDGYVSIEMKSIFKPKGLN